MNNVDQIDIPENVIKNLLALYGKKGRQWIIDLPKYISHYENIWQFNVTKCYSDAQFNVVLEVRKNNGIPAVFKCCFPNKEFTTEVLALQHYNGSGAVKIFKADSENGAMLLDRITPGTVLEKITSVEDATKKAVSVCSKLHKPISDAESFPTLIDWFDGFDQRLYKKFNNTTGPFEKSFIEKAKSISDALLYSQSKIVLLHGDLHYANLLLAENNDAKSIDAKGVCGEPEFEIPLPRVTNPIEKKELMYRLDCYIDQSNFDKKRIYNWLFSKAVLAAWWTVEGAPQLHKQGVYYDELKACA